MLHLEGAVLPNEGELTWYRLIGEAGLWTVVTNLPWLLRAGKAFEQSWMQSSPSGIGGWLCALAPAAPWSYQGLFWASSFSSLWVWSIRSFLLTRGSLVSFPRRSISGWEKCTEPKVCIGLWMLSVVAFLILVNSFQPPKTTDLGMNCLIRFIFILCLGVRCRFLKSLRSWMHTQVYTHTQVCDEFQAKLALRVLKSLTWRKSFSRWEDNPGYSHILLGGSSLAVETLCL